MLMPFCGSRFAWSQRSTKLGEQSEVMRRIVKVMSTFAAWIEWRIAMASVEE